MITSATTRLETMTSDELDQLKRPEIYRKENVAWFMSKDDRHWELSNMAGGMPLYWPLVRCPENHWNSSEQLYQATKYGTDVICLPESSPDADPSVRRRIHAQATPRGAKLTQKCAVKAGLLRVDWEDPSQEIRIQAMLWVLELKLYWNPMTFGRVLQETGDRPIVEISKKDAFWGGEVAPDATVSNNPRYWSVRNRVAAGPGRPSRAPTMRGFESVSGVRRMAQKDA